VINGTLEMPVIAGTAEDGDLPLTAKWAGSGGNEIVIRVKTEAAGVTLGVTAMAGGAVDPDIEPALSAIGQVWETFIMDCLPWKNAARLDQYQAFCEGRWSELEKKPCMVAHGSTDNYATRTAVTDQRKNDYANFLIQSTGSPEPSFVVAAKGLTGIMNTANSNPPMGYKTPLSGLEAGTDAAQENYQTRNNAFAKGASTNIKSGSSAELSDVISFYHPDGEAIPSRRYVVDLVKLQNIVFNVRLILESTSTKPLRS
jgi:phage tail sheath gpL-like